MTNNAVARIGIPAELCPATLTTHTFATTFNTTAHSHSTDALQRQVRSTTMMPETYLRSTRTPYVLAIEDIGMP